MLDGHDGAGCGSPGTVGVVSRVVDALEGQGPAAPAASSLVGCLLAPTAAVRDRRPVCPDSGDPSRLGS